MDESHRLKPMGCYDEKLFNQLYKEVLPLIKKLSRGIDCRRYGVEYQDIESWFATKFIYAFNKYHQTQPKYLKGFLIRSVQLYSMRLMKQAYQDKYIEHLNQLDISEVYDENLIDIPDQNTSYKEALLERALSFFKSTLSDDAFMVLQIELNPPDYILEELKFLGLSPNSRIPTNLIAEYLERDNEQGIKYIKGLRRQITRAIQEAQIELP